MTEHAAMPAALSPQQLEQLWAEHLKGEFATKDVEATLKTMNRPKTRSKARRGIYVVVSAPITAPGIVARAKSMPDL